MAFLHDAEEVTIFVCLSMFECWLSHCSPGYLWLSSADYELSCKSEEAKNPY